MLWSTPPHHHQCTWVGLADSAAFYISSAPMLDWSLLIWKHDGDQMDAESKLIVNNNIPLDAIKAL